MRPVYRRPALYAKQHAAIFAPERYAVIEASTKSGKTTGCLVWITEQAIMLGTANRNYWWVAPVYGQAEIAYRRLKRGLDPSLYTANETKMTITLANGAVIWFKSAEKPDNLYGEDVYAAVIDEASRVKEASWHAVRSTLTATRGPVRLIGNVKGRKNFFYRLARRAQSGARGMSYHKLTALDAVRGGVLELAEVLDAKHVLPPDIFNELYLAIPSEDGANPFGFAAIERCIVPALSEEPVSAWGWDLAKRQDWTVGIGLDSFGVTAEFERFQRSWDSTITLIDGKVGYAIPTLIDATGVGDPIVEQLQKGRENVEGYVFTATKKQQLMLGLAVAIQTRACGYPDGQIREELDAMEYVYKPTGVKYLTPEGVPDDCVMALALAVEARTRPLAGGILLQGRASGWTPQR